MGQYASTAAQIAPLISSINKGGQNQTQPEMKLPTNIQLGPTRKAMLELGRNISTINQSRSFDNGLALLQGLQNLGKKK